MCVSQATTIFLSGFPGGRTAPQAGGFAGQGYSLVEKTRLTLLTYDFVGSF